MASKNIHFIDTLWKVKAIKEIMELEQKGWKVTRDSLRDHQRTIAFIKYGFEEGVKFAKSQDGGKKK